MHVVRVGKMSTVGHDGYYYRDDNGKVHGPFTQKVFQIMRRSGKIQEGTHAWRTAMGMAFKVKIGRKFTLAQLLSAGACNHAWELVMITFTCLCTAYALTLLNWKEEQEHGNGGAVYFLIILTIITFGMVIVTIRTIYRRWRNKASEEYVSEV